MEEAKKTGTRVPAKVSVYPWHRMKLNILRRELGHKNVGELVEKWIEDEWKRMDSAPKES